MKKRAVFARLWGIWMVAGLMNSAQAAPMGFKESVMAMGDFSPRWQEGFVNYALTARDAMGLSTLRMKSDNEALARDLTEVTYTRLLKRWNLPEAQANVWFIGGAGHLTGNDFFGTRILLAPGVQVDYETTYVYASVFVRLYRAEGIQHDFASARVGFSLDEADYEKTQPWLIFEVRRMQGLSMKTEFTPMLRLIHKRYFAELGINNSTQLRANLMYIF
jgi:hypothetical protein